MVVMLKLTRVIHNFTAMKKNLLTQYYSQSKSKQDSQQVQSDLAANLTSSLNIDNVISPLGTFADGLGSWKEPLSKFIASKVFSSIYQFVKEEYKSKTIYPKEQDIFNAFKLTPITNVKAVIIGQDPYHGPNQAHGLCFSVLPPTRPPPSLVNIYKNLEADPEIQFKGPKHGDLTSWAKQGVLLLNASLTVQQGKPNSHAECGWQKFTDEVIKIANQQCQGVVFFLWGSFAQKKGSVISTSKHLVLKTTHPSPLSAHRGFLESKQFSECNSYLKAHGREPIDWRLDP